MQKKFQCGKNRRKTLIFKKHKRPPKENNHTEKNIVKQNLKKLT